MTDQELALTLAQLSPEARHRYNLQQQATPNSPEQLAAVVVQLRARIAKLEAALREVVAEWKRPGVVRGVVRDIAEAALKP